MIIKRIGWKYGLNPRTLWEDTETGKWGYISYRYSVCRCEKDNDYKMYKRYVQSLQKYEIVLEK